jgi:type I restriction enzyme S subunit
MNAELLFQHFNRISEAPNAFVRLRRFVLDSAVRGKLVEQDPHDEPASKLLGRLESEKTRRVKIGEIRNPRMLEVDDADDQLFPLPSSWKWVRLADVGAIVGGGTPPSEDVDNFTAAGAGVAWVTPADLGKHCSLYVSRGSRDLTEKGLKASSATVMPKGTVLFTSRAPIGYTAIALNEISTNQGFKSVVPYIPDCARYVAIYLQAFTPWIEGEASGTTFREVSGKTVSGLPFPLPPLAEQHRIVAKVDELLAMCDQLEAAKTEREQSRDQLVRVSLKKLSEPDREESVREHAGFLLSNLARLTTRVEHVKQLRRTVLNLAIRGKLVPQVSTDEPAAALHRRLVSEVATFAAERGISAPKVDPITEGAMPFSLPSGWVWSRLTSLFKVITDGDHQPPPRAETGVAFLTIGNVTTGQLDFSSCRFVPQEYFDAIAPHRRPTKGDFLYTVVGATYGRPALVDTDRPFCVQRHIGILKPVSEIELGYLHLLLSSPLIYEQATRSLTGTAQPTIPLRPLRSFLAPLPPLAEQHRIVAKVTALMALCDQLEAQLVSTDEGNGRLLEAVLHEALATEALATAA